MAAEISIHPNITNFQLNFEVYISNVEVGDEKFIQIYWKPTNGGDSWIEITHNQVSVTRKILKGDTRSSGSAAHFTVENLRKALNWLLKD